ncbi:response regulator transcription factor [Bacillus cereus]|uniref:response regulator transcription factor n=1 Tax=Bacillus TaxID=1386 RepID=UPI0007AC0610|nr:MULTISPECIES: response regulator transcription factor [Bacillus]KZD82795.1 Nitrate/nitrite response regulator protein [Bacillus cereus]MCC2454352.1 response regulator transcription factor [Bacillus cereus]MCI2249191.1 response regulator transcription factor [Bacillus cereus]MCQ6291323.1 response regulator transcription factor [Bacillus cereus]MCT1380078.1 response regulator transcription factor [Bacillus sp. p3-SID196]
MISVLVVDDHVAVGLGTKALIEKYDEMNVDVVHDSMEVEKIIKNQKYDVYLIDLQMPNINGLELSKKILKIHSEASILIFTGFDVLSHYNLLIDSGVLGVLSKTSSEEQVITSIRHAVKKEVVLSQQFVKQLRIKEAISNIATEHGEVSNRVSLNEDEKQILIEVSKGKTNKELAGILNLSQRSIEYKLTDIFHKLKVSSRMEAVQKAKELWLIPSLDL